MMPTKDQCQELIDNTTSIFGSGVRKFTSKKDSSKYIFIPAAGDWSNTTILAKNVSGGYWSTQLYSSPQAWGIYFNSESNSFGLYLSYRISGRSIHPVAPPKPW